MSYNIIIKNITVPKIKLSKLLKIRVAIPYPGYVRTASNIQSINQVKIKILQSYY